MSGHSKWATTKRHKSVIDSKRANVFTKLARAITVAAKTGKGLDLAIEQARAANMPKENIQRAIDKGTGKLASIQIEEHIYEAYAPGGVAIIIKVLTDNKNRTVSELRSILSDHNGKMAESGSVNFLFDQKGIIEIEIIGQTLSKNDLEMVIIDSGAEDYEELEEQIYIYTKPYELEKVKKALEFKTIKIVSAKLEMMPKNYVKISDDNKESIIKLLEALEENDDVGEVFTNADL